MKQPYIKVKDAAAELGVSKMTIYKFLKEGYFTGKKFGKQIRIDRGSFEQYIQNAQI